MNCEKCGKLMLERSGSKGPFWGCSGYPECRNTKSGDKNLTNPEITPPQASKREYALTDGNIRSNALRCAIEMMGHHATGEKVIENIIMPLAVQFEDYIRNGIKA